MADALALQPARVLPEPRHYAGLTVEAWPDQALASVTAPRAHLARLGIDAPDRPAWCRGWIATGPDRWLVARRQPSADLPDLGDAAVVDLSDAYACLTLRGPALPEVMAKGVDLDLDPGAFGPGSAAVTAIAHIGVILWCEDDAARFELAVTRSYAGSLLHWLEAAATPVDLGDP